MSDFFDILFQIWSVWIASEVHVVMSVGWLARAQFRLAPAAHFGRNFQVLSKKYEAII